MATTILGLDSNKFGGVKAMRSLRALRPLRVIKSSPKLKQVVNAFFSSITAIKNILFIGALLLTIFSVIGVSLFKGKYWSCDCDDDSNIWTKQDCVDMYGESSWVRNDSNFDDMI